MFRNKNTLTSYDDYTKTALIRLLEEKKQGLIYIDKEIIQNKKIVKGYFNSIVDEKEMYKRNYQEWSSIKDLKWKVLIVNKSEELEELRNIKNDILRRITDIESSLITYDSRYHKKFGRKSPKITLDFGYNIGLSH